MADYVLSMTADYVGDWTVMDALRELFQNAQDQALDNGWDFSYTYEDGVLRITNPHSWLDRSTLLLGQSSKRKKTDEEQGADGQVGQFGEGYKLACLVLCRNGKKVTIYNNNYSEVWKPRIAAAKRYNNQKVLVFGIDGRIRFSHSEDEDLVFEVEGLTQEEWTSYQLRNLNICPPKDTISTTYGDILLNETFKGEFYIGGLYVGSSEEFNYGYNIKPAFLKIDRDRRILPSFDTRWVTSRMWSESNDPKMMALLWGDAADTSYIEDYNITTTTADSLATQFLQTHGESAYPVSNDAEFAIVAAQGGYRPVIVNGNLSKLLRKSSKLPDLNVKERASVKGQFKEWFSALEKRLQEAGMEITEAERETFDTLVGKVYF